MTIGINLPKLSSPSWISSNDSFIENQNDLIKIKSKPASLRSIRSLTEFRRIMGFDWEDINNLTESSCSSSFQNGCIDVKKEEFCNNKEVDSMNNNDDYDESEEETASVLIVTEKKKIIPKAPRSISPKEIDQLKANSKDYSMNESNDLQNYSEEEEDDLIQNVFKVEKSTPIHQLFPDNVLEEDFDEIYEQIQSFEDEEEDQTTINSSLLLSPLQRIKNQRLSTLSILQNNSISDDDSNMELLMTPEIKDSRMDKDGAFYPKRFSEESICNHKKNPKPLTKTMEKQKQKDQIDQTPRESLQIINTNKPLPEPILNEEEQDSSSTFSSSSSIEEVDAIISGWQRMPLTPLTSTFVREINCPYPTILEKSHAKMEEDDTISSLQNTEMETDKETKNIAATKKTQWLKKYILHSTKGLEKEEESFVQKNFLKDEVNITEEQITKDPFIKSGTIINLDKLDSNNTFSSQSSNPSDRLILIDDQARNAYREQQRKEDEKRKEEIEEMRMVLERNAKTEHELERERIASRERDLQFLREMLNKSEIEVEEEEEGENEETVDLIDEFTKEKGFNTIKRIASDGEELFKKYQNSTPSPSSSSSNEKQSEQDEKTLRRSSSLAHLTGSWLKSINGKNSFDVQSTKSESLSFSSPLYDKMKRNLLIHTNISSEEKVDKTSSKLSLPPKRSFSSNGIPWEKFNEKGFNQSSSTISLRPFNSPFVPIQQQQHQPQQQEQIKQSSINQFDQNFKKHNRRNSISNFFQKISFSPSKNDKRQSPSATFENQPQHPQQQEQQNRNDYIPNGNLNNTTDNQIHYISNSHSPFQVGKNLDDKGWIRSTF